LGEADMTVDIRHWAGDGSAVQFRQAEVILIGQCQSLCLRGPLRLLARETAEVA